MSLGEGSFASSQFGCEQMRGVDAAEIETTLAEFPHQAHDLLGRNHAIPDRIGRLSAIRHNPKSVANRLRGKSSLCVYPIVSSLAGVGFVGPQCRLAQGCSGD